ncbi:hypothetical protein NLI96_g1502 [Meripilus lineatus]|uniref:Cation efflux protein transmembrane domain-containing protein n=1 Tax=Meripilus lineatus TaxID=2056292 RepID=A0AAD5VAB5_9APHY|nr:hypothetical protein NLI96_g1502 [Physisporinus lineatus]
MATITSRRPYSTQPKGKEPERNGFANHNHENHNDHDHNHHHHNSTNHNHEHDHDHEHDHTHSHSIFGSLTHTHAPGENGHSHDAEKIVEALKGGGDRGSRITVVGLVSNVGLTVAKGAAGWYMNSASLLADSVHSLSDLLGDFVTLFAWKLSRRPPSERYPYGFGKFEVLGTTTISLLLTGGAIGIGIHSWYLFADALSHTASHMSPGLLHDLILQASNVTQSVPTVALGHAHEHSLDPNAAWFAGISVVAKEWLYRITKKVADEERSPVLLANAVHHRSDAYSSLVAFIAILGSWWFPHLPLDPIGGLLVSILIFRQGWAILKSAFVQLTDGSVSPKTKRVLQKALVPLLPSPSSPNTPQISQIELSTQNLLEIRNLRAMRTGASMLVDIEAIVPRDLSISGAVDLEDRVKRTLKGARKEISEVRVKFIPVDREKLV